jgi:hypothetical protein
MIGARYIPLEYAAQTFVTRAGTVCCLTQVKSGFLSLLLFNIGYVDFWPGQMLAKQG